MKALVYHGRRDIRLEEVPTPVPGPEEVLIKVTHAGLSQTQVNEFMAGPVIINKKPNPLTGKSIPLIPSQEYGGQVVRVGKGVDSSIVGKRVAVLPLISCGKCEYCLSGRENLCPKLAYYGLVGLDGGFAEFSVVRKENIIPVDNDDLLTFVEPMLVAIHAFDRCFSCHSCCGRKVIENMNILVLGAGTIGVTLATVWKKLGVKSLTINDLLDKRLKTAQSAGISTVNKRGLKRENYDIVVDAAGMYPWSDRQAITEGFTYLKRGGALIGIGSYFYRVTVEPLGLLVKEKSLLPSLAYTKKDIEVLRNLLKEDFNFKPFITEISLNNIIKDGYYRAEIDRGSFTRIVVRC